MLTIAIACEFGELGYIANPFWPDIGRLIDITKMSGMNRARSTANRRKALEEHLQMLNMTLADFEALEKRAAEPFYRADNGDIIIPELHVSSFLVATCDEIRANSRPCEKDQVRSRFKISPWLTGKRDADGTYERYVQIKSGGMKLSNQRRLAISPYIKNFTATGTLSFDENFVDQKTLKRALEWGGEFKGIGSARKMGYGRFTLKEFVAVQADLVHMKAAAE